MHHDLNCIKVMNIETQNGGFQKVRRVGEHEESKGVQG